MTNSHYRRTIETTATPEQAYAALTTGYDRWWTAPDRVFGQVGDEAVFSFPPHRSYWGFTARKLAPFQRVERVCSQALHVHPGQPKSIEQEWLGTTITWTTETADGKTLVHMVHEGLQPALVCFDICAQGWDHFFARSLAAYLNTGVGAPHGGSTTVNPREQGNKSRQ
jgi:hypothetical protein